MQLSIIIVNYNVKFFLEQALLSVRKAVRNVEAEIFVVDNNSVDGSVAMLKEKFPEVIVIENKDNVGFAKANNAAIKQSKGEFILLLNPDTVVEEDTFTKCIHFMQQHPDAGGVGAKMVDGKGNFLPESKRGFPTPSVAFCKAFGLSKLFPRSKTFNRYHLGFLSENETHEIDVLAGAFMFLRKAAIEKAGLLDENFFMYGEDIDFSFRLVKAGFKNYYFPETRIIHYKGESTKKGSLNYVRLFYQAMILFAQKHYASQAGWYVLMLKLAIYLRAVLSLVSRVMKKILLPLLDAAVLYAGILALKNFWQNSIKEELTYPIEYALIVIPAYIIVWLTFVFLNGGYEKNAKPFRIVRGLFFGTIGIAAIYAFLPESLRFSRAIILLGFVYGVVALIAERLLVHFIMHKNLKLGDVPEKRMMIVGNADEAQRVVALLNRARIQHDYIGWISSTQQNHTDEHYLGAIQQLNEIASIYKADEIIFCARDVSSQQTIEWMTRIGTDVEYKIVPEDSMSIIGSNSKDAPGELYTIDVKLNIATPFARRSKWLFDAVVSLLLLIFSPLEIFIVKHPASFLKNIFLVLGGRKSWVGYAGAEAQQHRLPEIKPGVLTPVDELQGITLNEATITRINLLYAKDYAVARDAALVWKCFRKLGSH